MSTERFEISIPRSVRHLGTVRAFFRTLVRETGILALSESEIGEVQLVLQEACVNSIRHAGGTPSIRIGFE